MELKIIINGYLQTEEPIAKAIRDGIRKNKLPLLAEYLTNKTDKHETESEFPPTSVSTEKLQRRDNVDILKETKQKGE